MLDELLYVFLRALEFDGDDPLPLITEWNYAIARVQKVFNRMTDKDPNLVAVVRCCECVYHDDDSQYHYCRKWRRNCPNDSDFFCKWGKRKDGGRDDA